MRCLPATLNVRRPLVRGACTSVDVDKSGGLTRNGFGMSISNQSRPKMRDNLQRHCLIDCRRVGQHPLGASSPCADKTFSRFARVTFSLDGQRESNQREIHPSSSHSGHPALRVRARRPLVYGRTSLCVRRLAASMRPHFVLFASTDHRRSGAPTSTEARSRRAEANNRATSQTTTSAPSL